MTITGSCGSRINMRPKAWSGWCEYLPHPRTYQAALGQASCLSSFSKHLLLDSPREVCMMPFKDQRTLHSSLSMQLRAYLKSSFKHAAGCLSGNIFACRYPLYDVCLEGIYLQNSPFNLCTMGLSAVLCPSLHACTICSMCPLSGLLHRLLTLSGEACRVGSRGLSGRHRQDSPAVRSLPVAIEKS